jgi:Holliday junction resolvase RusA-like endonuclease
MLQLTIPGKPLGKQRHRTTILTDKDGHSFNHEYTPIQTFNFETLVRELFISKYPEHKPWLPGVPLVTKLIQMQPITKEVDKKVSKLIDPKTIIEFESVITNPEFRLEQLSEFNLRSVLYQLRATNKPDEDNCKKIVYDALNHLAWFDDSQICASVYLKVFSRCPRVVLTILTLEEYMVQQMFEGELI